MALDFPHRSESVDEWDVAYRRVESYLQACGVAPRLALTELAVKIIEQARGERAAHADSQPPIAVAMRVMFAEMAKSFAAGSPDDRLPDAFWRARGRLSFATAGAAPEWAKAVSERAPNESEVPRSWLEQPLQTGPELRLSKLPPAQIEYAFGDNDDVPDYAGRRIPIAAVALAMSVVGVMGAAWAATH